MLLNHESYEREIDFKELFFKVLHSWRIIILVSIAFAIIFSGYRYLSLQSMYNSTTEKAQEESYNLELSKYEESRTAIEKEIAYLQDSIKQQSDYNKNSLLMQIDPMNKEVGNLKYYIDSKYKIMPNVHYQNGDKATSIMQAYINEKLYDYVENKGSVDIEPMYLREIITITPDYDSHMISIEVTHKDEKKIIEILKLIKEYFVNTHNSINELISEHDIELLDESMSSTVDAILKETQNKNVQIVTDYQNRIVERKNALSILFPPTKFTISDTVIIKSAIKYAIIGMVAGAFLVSIFTVILYLLSDRIFNIKELRQRYNLRLLGIIKKEETRIFGFIDRWLYRLEGNKEVLNNVDAIKYIVANIKNIVKTEDISTCKIMLTGTIADQEIEYLGDIISNILNNEAIKLICSGNICSHSNTIEQINDCNAVIIVERLNKSTYSDVSNELVNIQDMGKKILGLILI